MTTATAVQPASMTDRFRDVQSAPCTSHGLRSRPLNAALFCGPFSVVDDRPVEIVSVPGTDVRVNKGSLWITDTGDSELVRVGEHYAARSMGVLTLSSARGAEVCISLP